MKEIVIHFKLECKTLVFSRDHLSFFRKKLNGLSFSNLTLRIDFYMNLFILQVFQNLST